MSQYGRKRGYWFDEERGPMVGDQPLGDSEGRFKSMPPKGVRLTPDQRIAFHLVELALRASDVPGSLTSYHDLVRSGDDESPFAFRGGHRHGAFPRSIAEDVAADWRQRRAA